MSIRWHIYRIVICAVGTFATWLCLSVISSAFKTANENCGVDYVIDKYVEANLFCPSGALTPARKP